METKQDAAKEELKNKRLQLEKRGDIELEIQLHFRLVFGLDKGKLFWKASKQEIMINSLETIPGFNLKLLGVKPTYRKDEDKANSIVGSKKLDLSKEGPYILKSANDALSAILNNQNTKIYKVLKGGVNNSLNVNDMWNNHYKFGNMNEGLHDIANYAMSLFKKKPKKDDPNNQSSVEELVYDEDEENSENVFDRESENDYRREYNDGTKYGEENGSADSYSDETKYTDGRGRSEGNRDEAKHGEGLGRSEGNRDEAKHGEGLGRSEGNRDEAKHGEGIGRPEMYADHSIKDKVIADDFDKYKRLRRDEPGDLDGTRFVYTSPYNVELVDKTRTGFDNLTNTHVDKSGIRHKHGVMFEQLHQDLELFNYINEAESHDDDDESLEEPSVQPSSSTSAGGSSSGLAGTRSVSSGSSSSSSGSSSTGAVPAEKSDYSGKIIKTDDGIYELVCTKQKEQIITYNMLAIMKEENGNKLFFAKKVKNLSKDFINNTIQAQDVDQNWYDIVNAIYTYFIKEPDKAPKIFGKIDSSYISDKDKDAVKNNKVDNTSVFYKHVNMVLDTFSTNAVQSYETITEIEPGESLNMNAVNGTADDKTNSENYWETDDIYGSSNEKFSNIESVKSKSFIVIDVDNLKLRKTLKVNQFVEIDDTSILQKSNPVVYRLKGSEIGSAMRDNVEARNSRVNVNYIEFRAGDTASFLSMIMPDLVFVTKHTPNNTLGKLQQFAKRSGSALLSPGKQNKKQAEQKQDVAPYAKIKDVVGKK